MWRITDFKNTLKFHFHTQKLELLCTALKKKQEKKKKSTAQWLSFEWPYFTGFHQQRQDRGKS